MAALGLLAIAFAVFAGVGVHKADIKKEVQLEQQITELKTSHKIKPKKTVKIIRNQNIEVINMGDA